jgi:hypothetical protein
MRFESFSVVGPKVNRLISYQPNDPFYANYPVDQRFSPVEGPLGYSASDNRIRLLSPSDTWEFDACNDYKEFRRNSYRGRRRDHTFQLTADYRDSAVLLLEKPLSDEDLSSFQVVINLIRAFVQGQRVRSSFTVDLTQVFYIVNLTIYDRLIAALEKVHARTKQTAGTRANNVPAVPTWILKSPFTARNSMLTANDWEVLASTYRVEIESFSQICLYLGFDFREVEVDDNLSDDGSDNDVDDTPFTPKKLDQLVMDLLTDSHKGKGKMPAPRISSVSFLEPVSPTPGSRLHFPTSSEPRGRQSATPEPVPPSPIAPERPPTPVPDSPIRTSSDLRNVRAEAFAPIDPVGTSNTIPRYQDEQTARVYGNAPASNLPPPQPGPGTSRYDDMFRPSRFTTSTPVPVDAQRPGPSVNPSSNVYDTPEIGRHFEEGQSCHSNRSRFAFPVDPDPPDEDPVLTGGASSFNQ